MEKWLQHGAKSLPPLNNGDTVAVQDLTNKGKPGRWTKSGIIVEVLPHDAYLVKVHGSRALTKRNRRFLRKITPFTPASPITYGESYAVPPLPTQANRDTTSQPPPVPVTPLPEPPVLPQPSPPTNSHQTLPAAQVAPTAATHRHQPAAAPGSMNIVDLLKQREDAGLHLALEMDWRALYH